ncbi:MAG: hypothetical protein ACYDH5_04950 [Acidimicrobiales bacterium]
MDAWWRAANYLALGDREGVVDGDVVVMATGRDVVLPDGVEHLGLAAGDPPRVDHLLATANLNVYAPGDVDARSMLFHSAVRQSLVAGHVILAGGHPVDAMNFEAVPMTVFTEPAAVLAGREATHHRVTSASAWSSRCCFSWP